MFKHSQNLFEQKSEIVFLFLFFKIFCLFPNMRTVVSVTKSVEMKCLNSFSASTDSHCAPSVSENDVSTDECVECVRAVNEAVEDVMIAGTSRLQRKKRNTNAKLHKGEVRKCDDDDDIRS